jgi:hypothetical protein
MENDYLKGLTYLGSEPDMTALRRVYDGDINDSTGFYENCVDAFNQRRMIWPGKSRDQKKHAVDAKPFRFASDQEVPVIDPRINTLVALMMNAVRDGNIHAFPVNSDSAERSADVSTFIRWMIDCWIPNSYTEIELALNYMLEKGFAATFCGWETKSRKHKELLDIELIAEQDTEMAEMLVDEEREEEALETLQMLFMGLGKTEGRRALKSLRNEGITEVPVVRNDTNRPSISAKDPAGDIIIPSYTMDTSRMTRIHIRHFLTAQDLENGVATGEWNRDTVDDILTNHMGITMDEIDGPLSGQSFYRQGQIHNLFNAPEDLVEIVETYQRFVDPDDGAEGIYRTVWSPRQAKTGIDNYLSFELMNGWDEFPVVITPLFRDTKRILDVRNVCNLLKGTQRQAKVTRDSFIDQMSLAVNPPRTHPAGRPPAVWGAGADMPTRRGEENLYRTMEIPNTMRQGVELERYLDDEADRIMGLQTDNAIALQRQQYFINRALEHLTKVARLCYKNYQKFGPDEIFFRVTGNPDPVQFNKTPYDEELDIKIMFDARMNDNTFVKETVRNLITLSQNDPDGAYDSREIRVITAHLVSPQFASRIVRPEAQAREDILRKVAEDLSFIYSGQQIGARPNGAQIALEYIAEYTQKPAIQQRLQTDPEFAQNLQLYIQQYEQQMAQMQNAEIGRLGTAPAELQGINE